MKGNENMSDYGEKGAKSTTHCSNKNNQYYKVLSASRTSEVRHVKRVS